MLSTPPSRWTMGLKQSTSWPRCALSGLYFDIISWCFFIFCFVLLASFFITLASQDELRERLGRRVPQTGCHLDSLLDWGSPSRPPPVAGQGWQFENNCIFLDNWYLLLSGAHSNGKPWQPHFLRFINNFEVSSNRQIKPTMSSSLSSTLRDAVIVSYLTSHSSTTFSTSIQ